MKQDVKNQFNKWFKDQFGQLPKPSEAFHDLALERERLNVRLAEINDIFKSEENLRIKYDAALYTYQMKG